MAPRYFKNDAELARRGMGTRQQFGWLRTKIDHFSQSLVASSKPLLAVSSVSTLPPRSALAAVCSKDQSASHTLSSFSSSSIPIS